MPYSNNPSELRGGIDKRFDLLYLTAGRPHVGQKCGKQPQKWEECTYPVDEDDSKVIGQDAQHRSPQAAQAKAKAVEEAGDHADAVGQHVLRVDDDSGKG